MKILHIGDQAGVACIIAKCQVARGHDSVVLISGNNDKYGIYKFYQEYIVQVSELNFLQSCIMMADNADVLHIHSRPDVCFALRKRFRSSKKIIIHFHGTDLRGLRKFDLPHRSFASDLLILAKLTKRKVFRGLTWPHKLRQIVKLADAVIVATPDLQKYVPTAIYLPNPVDTDHFRPLNQTRYEKKKEEQGDPSVSLTINSEATEIDRTISVCRHYGIAVKMHDRTKSPSSYADMPRYLSRFKTYVDIRFVNGQLLENLSKTALEALSCGLDVINHQLRFQKGLPSQHNPQNVVASLDQIYGQPVQFEEESAAQYVEKVPSK